MLALTRKQLRRETKTAKAPSAKLEPSIQPVIETEEPTAAGFRDGAAVPCDVKAWATRRAAVLASGLMWWD